MADVLGEKSLSREYQKLFDKGSRKYDELLWNGEYYVQKVDVLKGLEIPTHLVSPDETCNPDCKNNINVSQKGKDKYPKYQYGEGCLSDQLLGQYLSHVAGIGYVLNPEHVKKAIKSIYNFNFKKSLDNFANVQRVYALNDESGLLLCSWPHGSRPALPFVYSDEVWTGIEYQVAATLIYNNWIEEGLNIVKAVRERYDGMKRNPWDEEECGHHYARAMSSWAVLLSLSGYDYNGISHELTFAPKISQNDFSTFWSCGTGWGEFKQQEKEKQYLVQIELNYGELQLYTLKLGSVKRMLKNPVAKINGKNILINIENSKEGFKVSFGKKLKLEKNDILEITL